MKIEKRYCPYCGQPLENRCGCLREIAEAEEEFIREYESRPDVQYGWHQQDMIDLRRMER